MRMSLITAPLASTWPGRCQHFFEKIFPMAGPGCRQMRHPYLTRAAGCGLLYALNREAHAVELQIIMIILVLLAVGIAGGIILAYAFDIDSRARQRRQRIKRIKERAKMRKITKTFC